MTTTDDLVTGPWGWKSERLPGLLEEAKKGTLSPEGRAELLRYHRMLRDQWQADIFEFIYRGVRSKDLPKLPCGEKAEEIAVALGLPTSPGHP